jgi:hypothetical protein
MRSRHLGRATVLLSISMVLGLAACGGAASMPAGGASSAPQLPQATAGPTAVGNGNGGNGTTAGGGSGNNGNPVLDAARRDLLVIKTGTLTVEVEDLNGAVARATTELAGLGGYVSGSSQTGSGRDMAASVTYRVPADRWDEALVAVRSIAKTVVAEQTQTEDVALQVVDLGARVKNLEATERAIQAVMDKAKTIDEILAVQQELTKVRGEIEQAASEKADLTERATYSTLTVRFELVPAPAPSASPTPTATPPGFDAGAEVTGATTTLVRILQRLATIGIWLGIVWLPVLGAIVLVGVPILLFVRRRLMPVASWVAPDAAGPLPPTSPTPPGASAGT